MQFKSDKIIDPRIQSEVIKLSLVDSPNPADDLEVLISPEFGSNMYQFRKGKDDLIYCDFQLLKDRDWTGCFVLWPIPNRVSGKEYTFEDTNVSLADIKRKRGNYPLIHGLVDDKEWQVESVISNDNNSQAVTSFEITEESSIYKYFPFASKLTLTYTLTTEGLRVEYLVENRGDKNLPYGFALHPYFSLLSGRDETKVMLPADALVEADEELLPTGELLDVTDTKFDLRKPLTVSQLELDHLFTMLNSSTPAYIDYTNQKYKLFLESSEEFSHMVLYTLEQPFICFENQAGSTDAINLHARATANGDEEFTKIINLQIAGPGESKQGYINYKIQTY